MATNVIGEYRRAYIKDRQKGSDQDLAHENALSAIRVHLLQNSAATYTPVSEKDLRLISELEKNPHYQILLEDVIKMPEEKQREYLRSIAKTPKLRLVK